MDPAGKVAVITGGASGLGEACATLLSRAGASVAVLDLASSGPTGIDCDVTNAASAEHAVETVMRRHGRIDICLNCAGIGGTGAIATADGPQDLAAFRRVIDVNLIGAVNVTRLCAYRMIGNEGDGADAERGVIINAASIASHEGQQGMGAYTASKAALAALTLVWARDLSAHNIRVLSIAAGFFDTPMTAGLPSPIRQALLATTEFPRRAGHAEEFAELALQMIRMPYLNGETVRLDGGTRAPARTIWTAPIAAPLTTQPNAGDRA